MYKRLVGDWTMESSSSSCIRTHVKVVVSALIIISELQHLSLASRSSSFTHHHTPNPFKNALDTSIYGLTFWSRVFLHI